MAAQPVGDESTSHTSMGPKLLRLQGAFEHLKTVLQLPGGPDLVSAGNEDSLTYPLSN